MTRKKHDRIKLLYYLMDFNQGQINFIQKRIDDSIFESDIWHKIRIEEIERLKKEMKDIHLIIQSTEYYVSHCEYNIIE